MKDQKLNILIVDAKRQRTAETKDYIFKALFEDFRTLNPGERRKRIENHESVKCQCAKELQGVLEILQHEKRFDIITVETESGMEVIRHIRDHHPELLQKTIAFSEDKTYRDVAKANFSVEAFDAYMPPIEQERFKEWVEKTVANK